MAYGIKMPRRWSRLAEVFRRAKRRRTAFALLVVIAAFSLFAVRWSRELSKFTPITSSPAVPETLPEEDAPFSVPSAYARAEILIRKARANEYRGRIGEVAVLWREALFLLDRISRADPSFKRSDVAEMTRQCEDKLRKLKY